MLKSNHAAARPTPAARRAPLARLVARLAGPPAASNEVLAIDLAELGALAGPLRGPMRPRRLRHAVGEVLRVHHRDLNLVLLQQLLLHDASRLHRVLDDLLLRLPPRLQVRAKCGGVR